MNTPGIGMGANPEKDRVPSGETGSPELPGAEKPSAPQPEVPVETPPAPSTQKEEIITPPKEPEKVLEEQELPKNPVHHGALEISDVENKPLNTPEQADELFKKTFG